MKGIIFTEFLELVETTFGYGIANALLDGCDLPSGGAYTSVGTYDHLEILTLVGQLQKLTGTPASDLLEFYGQYLFPKLAEQMNSMSLSFDGSIDLLCSLESIIHLEVIKLYPDAELPSFDIEKLNSQEILMEYRSCRPFAHLAKGLIDGCGNFYKEKLSVSMKHLNTETEFHTLISVRQS
jgi:hypothetical protein